MTTDIAGLSRAEVESAIRDWGTRECSSFDDAVAGSDSPAAPSIWDMPEIDSKRTVSLITELEELLGVAKIPVRVIKPGGYDSVDELVDHLIPKLCEELGPSDSALPAVSTRASASVGVAG